MSTSIVVPCYNEAARFDVAAFDVFLEQNREVDFILVNDGSTDATLELLRSLEQRWPERVRVIDTQPNQGKAAAVRTGVLDALRHPSVRYVGYFDADLATPLDAITEFVDVLERDPRIEIAMGARVALLGRRIERKPYRHYLGRVFASAASSVLGLVVYDTQCGAKLFRVSPRLAKIFAPPFGSRWIFDVEILARHLAAGGPADSIYELPLRRWTDVGKSHVRALDFLRASAEIIAIGRRYRLPGAQRGLRGVLAAARRRENR